MQGSKDINAKPSIFIICAVPLKNNHDEGFEISKDEITTGNPLRPLRVNGMMVSLRCVQPLFWHDHVSTPDRPDTPQTTNCEVHLSLRLTGDFKETIQIVPGFEEFCKIPSAGCIGTRRAINSALLSQLVRKRT